VHEPIRAVIFDLDGTLLDTLEDIAHATNKALESLGAPTHSLDAYRYMVGDGVTVLFHRAFPDSQEDTGLLSRCVDLFDRFYSDCWKNTARPYDGIPDLLDELVAEGTRIAILSNKPHAFTRQFADSLLGKWRFDPVFGARDEVPKKPDPAAVFEILESFGLPANQVAYVGDTNTDMLTGRSAGCWTFGVAWGFRPKAELIRAGAHEIAESPHHLGRLLASPHR
jgi:phosphoglycolate phosphatase